MPVADECRETMHTRDYFVVLHRRDPLIQIGYRVVEFDFADQVERISVFRPDLVGEKVEILSPLFGGQTRERRFTMSELGSEQEEAEQVLHKTDQCSDSAG